MFRTSWNVGVPVEIQIETAADHDGTYNFYRIDAYEDDFRIGRQGETDFKLDQAGNITTGGIVDVPNLKINGQQGSDGQVLTSTGSGVAWEAASGGGAVDSIANFSNNRMRNEGGEEYIRSLCDKFEPTHMEHIADYGSKNDERLTGLHETQHISKFSYGVSDRGASIRIPMNLTQNNWKGYLEDRRPAGNADPYKVTNRIVTTLES